MSYQIIRQPDGAYALWSSNIDDLVMIDAAPEQVMQYFLEQEEKRIREHVTDIIQKLAAGERPYHQFTMSWQDALDWYRERHGKAFDLEQARREMEADDDV